VLDLEQMFQSITKYSSRLLTPNVINEVVRKAFKLAQTEKTGATFIEFPENIAEMEIDDKPLYVKQPATPEPPMEKVERAAKIISDAKNPIILAGNGVIRNKAWQQLSDFAKRLRIPVANTFMAKGVVPFKHTMALGSAGLQANDYVSCGFNKADVIICIGYDLVEYHPFLWHPTQDRTIIHIDQSPAEVDAYYTVAVGVVGDIKHSLLRIMEIATPSTANAMRALRKAVIEDMNQHKDDYSVPMKPQKIIWDLRTAMALEDIAISDVGAHKMWMARMFRCEFPNTCLISNGFASMGIAVPGAIGAKLALPDRKVVAVTGDAGFLMNSQEIETALRYNTPFVILIWNDNGYGLIEWKQMNDFGRPSNIKFNNPDFVKYAESFGAKGYRIEKGEDLLPTLKKALADNTVSIIDCPVDYSENLKLTAKLGEMICPV
jgi:acetolactate synthase-1/2/3 large subunit